MWEISEVLVQMRGFDELSCDVEELSVHDPCW